METFHVSERSTVSRSPRHEVVIVRSVTPVLTRPQPFPVEFENFCWNYPALPTTLDSFFIALSPFYFSSSADSLHPTLSQRSHPYSQALSAESERDGLQMYLRPENSGFGTAESEGFEPTPVLPAKRLATAPLKPLE